MISPEQALKLSMLEKQHGLPSGLLKNVMTAESAGDPNAVSPKGAMGYFQFMPQTAAEYGVQDPTNFDQSATGAARMYADLSRKYNGDLPSMLAAYNWGQGNVDRKGLDNAPAETRGYIAKIMGAIGDAIVPPANAADLSGYSDEQLMQIAAQGKKDVSQMTADEELAHAGVPVNEPDLSGYSDEELMKIAQGVNQKQAAPQEEISLPEAMASNLAEGLTSGFAKKAVAGLVSGISGAPYEQVLQAATDRLAQGRAQHPYAAGINDVLGSIGGLLGGGYALAGQAPKAASALAEFAKLHPYLAGMGGGAVAGAARSAGDSVGSTDVASDMLGGAVRGLAAGGVGAAVAPAIGAAAGGLVGGTRAGASALTKLAERFGLKAESGKAGSVIQNLEQGAAPEFTVPPAASNTESKTIFPMTAGQRTGNTKLLQDEQEALRGNITPEAQSFAEAQLQKQNQAFRGYIEKLGGKIETGRDVNALVDNIGQTIRSKAEALNKQVDSAYALAREGKDVKITADDVRQGLFKSIADIRREGSYDLSQMPAAKSVVKRLAQYARNRNDYTITSIKLGELENWRKMASNAAYDSRGTSQGSFLSKTIRQYDDFMQKTAADAVDVGDADAIQAFRSAVSKRALFGNLFERNDFVKKLTDKSLSVDDARKLLMGTGSIKGRSAMANNFDALLKAAGNDAPLVQADLQDAFMQNIYKRSQTGTNLPNNPDVPQIGAGRLKTELENLFVNQADFAKKLYGDRAHAEALQAIKELSQIAGGKNRVFNPGSGTPVLQYVRSILEKTPVVGGAATLARKAGETIAKTRKSDAVIQSLSDQIPERLTRQPRSAMWAILPATAGTQSDGHNLQGKPPTVTIRPNKRGAQ